MNFRRDIKSKRSKEKYEYKIIDTGKIYSTYFSSYFNLEEEVKKKFTEYENGYYTKFTPREIALGCKTINPINMETFKHELCCILFFFDHIDNLRNDSKITICVVKTRDNRLLTIGSEGIRKL